MLLGHNRGEGKALEHNREEKKHNLPVPNYGSVRTKGDCTVHAYVGGGGQNCWRARSLKGSRVPD